ncbi:MAG: hypothetical protein P8P36_06210 [Akkermansiaceae bacterium]|nr:hypothetical protein [Akkermansiaceae bacterium]
MSSEHKDKARSADERQDPLWQLLESATDKEPSAFFARNTVREARLQIDASPTLGNRFRSLFAQQQIGKAVCLGLVVITAFLVWPSKESTSSDSAKPSYTTNQHPESSATATLNDLIIEESLSAAADDPSIYTRDEIVAMIGF